MNQPVPQLHPQFVVDAKQCKKAVILPAKEFDQVIEFLHAHGVEVHIEGSESSAG